MVEASDVIDMLIRSGDGVDPVKIGYVVVILLLIVAWIRKGKPKDRMDAGMPSARMPKVKKDKGFGKDMGGGKI
ncbi:MAG: hypothetical protein QF824_00555 [Candidatus Woesearchaeota archaeon]|jgi:hypothetical protein|nr:hypothetical protein [Candidatus Woesearchaeota archaeon]